MFIWIFVVALVLVSFIEIPYRERRSDASRPVAGDTLRSRAAA